MYKFLTKNGSALAFGLGIVIVVIGLISVMSGLEEFNMMSEEEQSQTTIFNSGIAAAIFLTVACFVVAILFGLYHTVSDLKGALKMVIGVGVIIVLVFVFYSTAEVETTGKVAAAIQRGELSGETSRWITGALATTGILLGLSFVSFIVAEIINLFR